MTIISVCIPTYNGARYLEACLDSVLRQTYTNIEILIVDDGSTDETLEIINKYLKQDGRIRLHRNESNIGLAGNWNKCITLANGDWIKFVFQDDILEPRCLEELIAATDHGHNLFVACNRRFQFEEDTAQDVIDFYIQNKRLIEQLYTHNSTLSAAEFADLAVERIGANLVGEPTVTLLHKCVFQKIGYFKEDLIMSCDLEYWIRAGIHFGLRFVHEDLAIFRVHSHATSASNRRRRQYRMKILDSLAIWHDVVHLDQYAPMRVAAKKRVPPTALQLRLKDKTHAAFILAQHFQSSSNERMALLAEWNAFVTHYPNLGFSRLTHMVWRLRNRSTYKSLLENARLLQTL